MPPDSIRSNSPKALSIRPLQCWWLLLRSPLFLRSGCWCLAIMGRPFLPRSVFLSFSRISNCRNGYLVAVLSLKDFDLLSEGLAAGYSLETVQVGEVPPVFFQQPPHSVRLFGNPGLGEWTQMASTKDPLLCGELASRSRVLQKIENPVARENVLRVKFQLQRGRAPG